MIKNSFSVFTLYIHFYLRFIGWKIQMKLFGVSKYRILILNAKLRIIEHDLILSTSKYHNNVYMVRCTCALLKPSLHKTTYIMK